MTIPSERYCVVLSCGAVCYAVQVGSNFCPNFWVCKWNPVVWPFKRKLLSSTFLCYCLWWCHKVARTYWVCGWNPAVWPSVTFPAVLFHGTNCFFFVFFFRFDVWYVMPWGGKWVSRFLFFFFSLLATKPAPTSFSYNILLCVITKNIGSNTVELITDFFPCCSDNDLHGSSLDLIGNTLNFLVNSWEIISVWISSPGQSGWWLALDDAS